MSLLNIIILGVVQGFAELLPVSSSAHVVVVEKLLGLDPSSPPMTLLLVMLHTGTMCAVIVYFWRPWRTAYFHSWAASKRFIAAIALATILTAAVGEGLVLVIARTALRSTPQAQIEDLFGHLEFMAPALAVGGILIVIAGLLERRHGARGQPAASELNGTQAGIIGAIQGLSLPFRGFSRSGATISTGMLLGVTKIRAETFSFALAVVLTPPVVAREVMRVIHSPASASGEWTSIAARTLLGALVAFIAGLLALKWLSRWLERGRWYLFGLYCLVAAVGVAVLHRAGY